MARLVSYKVKDDNRYSTFHNDVRYSSNENLTIHHQFKRMESGTIKKSISSVTTKSKWSCLVYCLQRMCCLTVWQRLCGCCCCCTCCITGSQRKRCCGCCGSRTSVGPDKTIKDFTQYKCELQLNEVNATSSRYRPDTVAAPDQRNITQAEVTTSRNTVNYSKKPKRKLWNWNDSLRSNSDKFLETLEYDIEGEKSLKRNYGKKSLKSSSYFQGI